MWDVPEDPNGRISLYEVRERGRERGGVGGEGERERGGGGVKERDGEREKAGV